MPLRKFRKFRDFFRRSRRIDRERGASRSKSGQSYLTRSQIPFSCPFETATNDAFSQPLGPGDSLLENGGEDFSFPLSKELFHLSLWMYASLRRPQSTNVAGRKYDRTHVWWQSRERLWRGERLKKDIFWWDKQYICNICDKFTCMNELQYVPISKGKVHLRVSYAK